MDSISVRAAAKLNLTLNITGTRGSMHTLDMLCVGVDLYEQITLTKASEMSLCCDVADIPTDARNTALRSAERFFAKTGIKGGVAIDINKNVPVGAGMGGGSADAAGVLVGLNRLYNTALSTHELCEIGITVGSDVPVCLVGGLCRVQGVGDMITPLSDLPKCYFVVTMAGVGVSTAEAYRRFDTFGTKTIADTSAAIKALTDNDFYRHYSNDMEYSTSIDINPTKARFLSLGAKKAMMTGSGAAVFGVFLDYETAKKACEYFNGDAWLLQPAKNGVEISG